MLLANPASGDDAAGGVQHRAAKQGFGHEDALGVVPQRPMPKVRDDFFRLVEPGMNADVIVYRAAPLLHA